MLIRIHRLRDKVYALARDLKQANADLEEEIRNCKHKWENPLRDDFFNNFCSGPIKRWVYTCALCGEKMITLKDPKDK